MDAIYAIARFLVNEILNVPAYLIGIITLWTSPAGQSYLATLRHAIASNATATRFIIADAILPLSNYILDPDDPHRETRIALIISQISGVATTRYLIGIEPMASLDTETLVKTVGPALQRYIDGDLT